MKEIDISIDTLDLETRRSLNEQETALAITNLPDLAPPGSGHNSSLMTRGRAAFRSGISFEDALDDLESVYEYMGQPEKAGDPLQALNKVYDSKGKPEKKGTKWDQFREEKLTRQSRLTDGAIEKKSPSPIDTSTADIIKGLFPIDSIVNIQRKSREGGSLFLCHSLPSNLDDFKFLSPATFKHLAGVEVAGRSYKSKRCNDNIKDRLYMVLEFDKDSEDSDGDAKVERFNSFAVDTFAKYAPLVLALYSGGKSNHFWYALGDLGKKEREAFFNHATAHGADPQLAVSSQVARMPNVSAGEDRKPQRVLFYNPTPSTDWDLDGLENELAQSDALEVYYCGKGYFFQNDDDIWTEVNCTSISNRLAQRGVRKTKLEGEPISPVEEVIANIEASHSVQAVLNGASGRKAGCYNENGIKFLVKTSPRLIDPREGKWTKLDQFFSHMFREEPQEKEILFGWLSAAIKDFRNDGKRRSRSAPRQALHLCGDASSGKTVFKKAILPALFGHRMADASAMFGPSASDFNSEMWVSDVLVLDDTGALGRSYKDRAIHSEQIKEICVGSGKGYHAKGQDRVNAEPWWIVVRLLNASTSTLETLPLDEEGVSDKWILLKASAMAGGGIECDDGNEWYDDFKVDIARELPCFLNYLISEHVVADEHRARRYAVVSYKNKALMSQAAESSVESSLLNKINTSASSHLFNSGEFSGKKPWQGTVPELWTILASVGENIENRAFEKMCPTPSILLSQLKNLEKAEPDQFAYSNRGNISPKKLAGAFYWRITPLVTDSDCF
jgi:hypothetical protein